jgi:flagellum-specific peptidoglycan hydrolase FlgJ
MLLSNPLGNITPYQNKNMGANPYQERMNGILQTIMAKNAAAARESQASSSSQGGLLKQIGGMEKILKAFKGGEQPPLSWENAPAPQGMEPIAQPMPPSNYGMEDVGKVEPVNYMPAKPSQNFKEMLPGLLEASREAYPDNPTMQKVALSQAILESGLTGKPSALATQNNNYFGIKASKSFPGTAGNVDYGTTEYIGGQPSNINQGFAANNSMGESFLQHRDLMYGANRYQPVIQSQSPEDAFAALQNSGYATDPNYARKLKSIYGRYVAPAYLS